MRRAIVVLPLLVLLVLAPSGCGDSPGSGPAATQEELAAPGPYGYAVRSFTFVDTSRPTPANDPYPGAPERQLFTKVWYPTDANPGTNAAGAALVSSAGPFPIIGYAHGFLSSSDESVFLKQHLASHGYIVVAPTFPLSNGGAPGGPIIGDIGDQPGDLTFVLRAVAALGGADADLAAAVDPSRQGIAGLSLGGGTVLIGVYHPVLHMPDIKAAVAYAPASCFFAKDFYSHTLPTLIMGGDADELVPFETSEAKAIAFAPPPLIVARLVGGTHLGFTGIQIPGAANTDAVIGCPAVEQAGAGMRGNALLVSELTAGTSASVVDVGGCGSICAESFIQTMSADRQTELEKAATLAQFESILRGRRDAQAYLDTVLGANPDVRLTLKR